MTARRTFGTTRKLSSGRVQARYVGPDGGRYAAPNRFLSKGDASKWLAAVETSISKGTWVSPSAPVAVSETFAAYAEAWLPKRDLRQRTRDLYRSQLDRFLLPAFGTLRLDAITVDTVSDWWDTMNAANPTQNAQTYTLLHTILGTAKRTRKIGSNPCDLEGASSVKRAKTITVLTPAELQTLAGLVPDRYRAMVLVSGFECLRFGEVTEMRRGDVANGKIKVARGVTWVKDEGKKVALVGEPKTEAGKRTVPMPAGLSAILAAHILRYAEPGDDGLVFPALKGGHLSHASMTTVFKKALKQMGRGDLTWHHLRHTGAVIWAQDPNLNLKDLMSLLGHESSETALLYQHVAAGKLDAAAERLNVHFPQGVIEEVAL
jgi:integrase